mmetsp:Transcript_73639/g.148343  ORF Transcript_73639/g.148343 Transcript_73639/m.148343 type:complete len:223 (-) Transcript_73639:144-812(-)
MLNPPLPIEKPELESVVGGGDGGGGGGGGGPAEAVEKFGSPTPLAPKTWPSCPPRAATGNPATPKSNTAGGGAGRGGGGTAAVAKVPAAALELDGTPREGLSIFPLWWKRPLPNALLGPFSFLGGLASPMENWPNPAAMAADGSVAAVAKTTGAGGARATGGGCGWKKVCCCCCCCWERVSHERRICCTTGTASFFVGNPHPRCDSNEERPPLPSPPRPPRF